MENTWVCLYLTAAVVISSAVLCQGSSWSYHGPLGPSNWGKSVPGAEACLGHQQSPINIDTYETRAETFLPFEMSGYDLDNTILPMPHPVAMLNNGHTVQINLEGRYQLSGGGLPHTYTAIQFHLHWGSNNNKGSEHTINGKAYPAEMHIVHFDSTNYDNVFEAVNKPDGLAVMGFFIKLGAHNYAWDPVINHIAAVRDELRTYTFPDAFALSLLIPRDLTRFYRYNGSLTTPGCFESVIWTVFENAITLSYTQLAQLRRMLNPEAPHLRNQEETGAIHLADFDLDKVQDNFRPVQRLWFRTVYQSWPREDEARYGNNEQPPWLHHFLGLSNGPAAVKTGEDGQVDKTGFELNGYGAYVGDGGGMHWVWQDLIHGETADHQDIEYYDYYTVDGDQAPQDTFHEPGHGGKEDAHHGGADHGSEEATHGGKDNGPTEVLHGTDNGPEETTHGSTDNGPEETTHGRMDNGPEGATHGSMDNGPEEAAHGGMDNGPKEAAHGGTDNDPAVAIDHSDPNQVVQEPSNTDLGNDMDKTQTDNAVPEGTLQDPQMDTMAPNEPTSDTGNAVQHG